MAISPPSMCAIVFALLLAGCASSSNSTAPQTSTPDHSEIRAAEAVAEQIERARIAQNWNEVNAHLASVGYTAQQRSASPSMPFVEITRKLGPLNRYELLISVGGAGYHNRKTGQSYPRVHVNVREHYGQPTAPTVDMELTMIKDDGQWKLGGIVALKSNLR